MRARSTSPWTTSTGCRAGCRCLCKVAPAKSDVHMEDVHRAGGIMAILGELDRAGLIHRELPTVHAPTSARCARAVGTSPARPATSVRCVLPGGARRRADPGRLQPGAALGRARHRPRRRASSAPPQHPFSRGRRPRRAQGQSRARRLHREDRRRRRSDPDVHRAGAGLREPGRRRARRSSPTRSSRATWSSSATKVPAAARACRRCSIRPAI